MNAIVNTRKVKKDTITIHNYITEYYETFLADQSSPKTASGYRGDLEQFFHFQFEKKPEFVTIEDLVSLTSNDIKHYRSVLKETKVPKKDTTYSQATIKRKIRALSSFVKHMEADHPEIRSAIFNNIKYKNEDDDSNAYGVLFYEEVMVMKDLAKGKSKELSMLIDVAFRTSMRLSSLLEMEWGNIHRRRNPKGQEFWSVEVIDKGVQHKKALPDSVVEELKGLRWSEDNEEKVFKFLSEHKVGDYIKELSEEMGIDERRNIKFHSLKKAGVNFVNQATGDVMMSQKQGNHRSPATTMKHYIKSQEDLTALPTYTVGETINLSPLQELSKEELLEAIGKMTASSQLELLRKVNS